MNNTILNFQILFWTKLSLKVMLIEWLDSVQFSRSIVSNSATPWIAARQTSLSITNSRNSPKLTSIKLVMPSNHLILCRPLLLLPPIPPSIRGFSNESTLRIRWPKYWSFSLSISPSNKHPGLVSFRMDWLDGPTFASCEIKGAKMVSKTEIPHNPCRSLQ